MQMFLSCIKMLRPENLCKSEILTLIPTCVFPVWAAKELIHITKTTLSPAFSVLMDGRSLTKNHFVQKSLSS